MLFLAVIISQLSKRSNRKNTFDFTDSFIDYTKILASDNKSVVLNSGYRVLLGGGMGGLDIDKTGYHAVLNLHIGEYSDTYNWMRESNELKKEDFKLIGDKVVEFFNYDEKNWLSDDYDLEIVLYGFGGERGAGFDLVYDYEGDSLRGSKTLQDFMWMYEEYNTFSFDECRKKGGEEWLVLIFFWK